MGDLFANPLWSALDTEQAGFAVGAGLARRYPADVIPFAGLADASAGASEALRELLAPGESIYTTGEVPAAVDGLAHVFELAGVQMHLPAGATIAEDAPGMTIQALGAKDAAAMVGLTDVAFPGFFRARTYVLGAYFGIRVDGVLVAMAGERMAVPGYREISAVCTHPEHTGKGYAAALIRHLLRLHRARGLGSFLHASAANARAVGLYERLGFTHTRAMRFQKMRRVAE